MSVLGPQWDDEQRAAVYRVHDQLPEFHRHYSVPDNKAKDTASTLLGQPVELVRVAPEHTGNRLLAKWAHPKGIGNTPVIYAPHDYPLSLHEIAHETAHLHADRLGVQLGHGRAFRESMLEFLPKNLRGHFEDGFRAEGLS